MPPTDLSKTIRPRVGLLAMLIAAGALSVVTPPAEAQQAARRASARLHDLLHDDPRPGIRVARRATRGLARRSRLAGIDIRGLENLPPDARVRLDLFADTSFVAVSERLNWRDQDSYTWTGRLEGGGRVTLVAESGAVAANIEAPGRGNYQIRSRGEERVVVEEVDPDQFPMCGGTQPIAGKEKPAQLPTASATGAAGGAGGVPPQQMDVMVFYTSTARAASGPFLSRDQQVALMAALTQLAIDTTNDAFVLSGIPGPEVRLVFRGEIDYPESGDAATDLAWLRSDSEVAELRDFCGADLVCLLVDDIQSGSPPEPVCGRANCGPGSDAAFSVVRRSCAAGSGQWSFAHEVAHNMGCAHDPDNVDCTGYSTYSRGHRFQVGPATARTIMAYPPGTRIQRFSNPDVCIPIPFTSICVPTGVAGEAHNALTIDTTSFDVAANRARLPGVSWVHFSHGGIEAGWFDTPFDTLPEALSAVPAGGAIGFVRGGAVSGPVTLSKRVTLATFGGHVSIGVP